MSADVAARELGPGRELVPAFDVAKTPAGHLAGTLEAGANAHAPALAPASKQGPYPSPPEILKKIVLLIQPC
jgi:hypothetical protein